MKTKPEITVSIVLFNERVSELHYTIESFLKIPLSKKLYLIDNTETNFFEYLFVHEDIVYLPVHENIGFGSGHNKIINEIKNVSNYHLILNPDVIFHPDVIKDLIKELEKDTSIAMIAPKVLFPDKSHQFSCRRYPSIRELFIRRFLVLKPVFNSIIYKGEYRERDLNTPFFAEYLTGCFHLYNTSDFVQLQGFDEQYFLYMEDVDICKKIDAINKKKLYYPHKEITHVLKQGSAKKIKLLFYHISSATKYFRKWGFS